MNRFIAFDVETPNSQNDRISAIGITVVEDGRILKKMYTNVNPETYFNEFNIRLTGISPQDVKNSPTFPQVWEKISPLMNSGILTAHNAVFDMKVLARCLNDYQIEHKRYMDYVCTVQMGKKCFPQLENHKLDTLCNYLNIPLNHHHAGSDSRACARLLLGYIKHGMNVNDFIRIYDTAKQRTVKKNENSQLMIEL